MIDLLIVPVALALDLVLGEMPRNLHPVVGMGKLLSLAGKIAPRDNQIAQFIYGAFTVTLVVAVFVVASYLLVGYIRVVDRALYVLVAAVLLKSCFSVRELAWSAARVKRSLLHGNVDMARAQLEHLVSRDTAGMPASHVAAAAIESVAENTSDSFVAPLFFFLIFGIPGAMAYRVCNTADAMMGYRGRFEYLGKFAARTDDVLNLLPARITGLLIVIASSIVKAGNRANSWRIMWRDHGLTESPNAGWPMSAMAGSLGVSLEKVGHYRLGNDSNILSPASVDTSIRLMLSAVFLWAAVLLTIKGVGLAVVSPA